MDLKPLGLVKKIVESVGMDISHAYDDLVFLNHNALLLQFTETNQILIHMNSEADKSKAQPDVIRLQEAAFCQGMKFYAGHFYTLEQENDESIRIKFTPLP